MKIYERDNLTLFKIRILQALSFLDNIDHQLKLLNFHLYFINDNVQIYKNKDDD